MRNDLSELGSLRALFGEAFDDDLLVSVLDSCGGDLQRAIDAMLAMQAPDSAAGEKGEAESDLLWSKCRITGEARLQCGN